MRKILVILLSFFTLGSYCQIGLGASGTVSQQKKIQGYSAEAQAAIDNLATPEPLASEQNIATCIDCLVSAGAWAEIDYILLMAVSEQTNALSNLINGNDATLAGTTPPTFTAYTKISGTGNGYIALGFTPSTDFVQGGLDDASYSVYVVTAPTGGASYIIGGRTTTSRVALQGDAINTRIRWTIHADDGEAFEVYDPTNVANNTYYTVERTGSTAEVLEEDGSNLDSGTLTSTDLPAIEIYGLGFNSNGTPGTFSDAEIAAIVIGSAAIDHGAVNTCIETFNTAQAP